MQPLVVSQAALPWALVHDSPQLRQFEVVPLVVSQPAALVQSRKPELQDETAQLPVEQVETAFGRLQVVPQSPQFESVCRSVSQPLPGLPSQLLKPLLQVGLQTKLGELPVHAEDPCVLVQVSPHAAQLPVVPSCVSQPACDVQSA